MSAEIPKASGQVAHCFSCRELTAAEFIDVNFLGKRFAFVQSVCEKLGKPATTQDLAGEDFEILTYLLHARMTTV